MSFAVKHVSYVFIQHYLDFGSVLGFSEYFHFHYSNLTRKKIIFLFLSFTELTTLLLLHSLPYFFDLHLEVMSLVNNGLIRPKREGRVA